MEPLKPDTKRQILQNRPQASPADIEEYERLLTERFTIDPDLPQSPRWLQPWPRGSSASSSSTQSCLAPKRASKRVGVGSPRG